MRGEGREGERDEERGRERERSKGREREREKELQLSSKKRSFIVTAAKRYSIQYMRYFCFIYRTRRPYDIRYEATGEYFTRMEI